MLACLRRDMLKSYRDGTMTEIEVAKAMENMMAAEADTKSSVFGGAVKKVVAHLTEAPTNWYGSALQLAEGVTRL